MALTGVGAFAVVLAFASVSLQGRVAEAEEQPVISQKRSASGELPTSTGFAPENHDGVPGVWLDGPDGFEVAKQIHLNSGSPLLIYVYTDWCPYCRRLNTQVLPDPGVQACLAQMTKVKINADSSEAAKRLVSQLRVAGYPTLLVRQKDDFMLRPFPTIVPVQQSIAACQAEVKRASAG